MIFWMIPLYGIEMKLEGGEVGLFRGIPQFGAIFKLVEYEDLGCRGNIGLDGNVSVLVEKRARLSGEPIDVFAGIGLGMFLYDRNDISNIYFPVQLGVSYKADNTIYEISKHSKGWMLGLRKAI